jgi:D-lactate dehydrogenase
MKIALFEINEEDQLVIQQLVSESAGLGGADVSFSKEKLSDETMVLAKDADAIGVFVGSEVRKETIDQIPNLKSIVAFSTGFDNIDIAYAKEKGIVVSNVPAYGSRTVAEYAFALILGLSRKTFKAYRQVKDTHVLDISAFEGFNLQGKTLGIVGTGRIGQNVAKIAKGFEMNVLANDEYPNQKAADELGFKYVPLADLLRDSDIVTLHVPYMPSTHHLINKDNIGSFKKGAFLINTSRGEVVESEALISGIKSGVIAAAGIDVIEGERQFSDEWQAINKPSDDDIYKDIIEDQILVDMPEVAYTPHMAFFTKEAKHDILATSIGNLNAFASGTPQNIVNK